MDTRELHTTCTIVPPYLLVRLAKLDDPRFAQAAAAARASLLRDSQIRQLRGGAHPFPYSGARTLPARTPGESDRTISDAGGQERLPGRRVRAEGQPAGTDPATNEAYDGLGATQNLFWTQFGRDSIDGNGLPMDATVHYGKQYDNAFWDGERMVFGDGDGQVFTRFTISPSVIGHELTHGVTQFTANLTYQGQSGALNESISDVFGALVEQHVKNQSTAEASWLIGEGLFTDQVEGVALRSMKAPGTAYNDDVLGKDPQPDTMAGYVETEDDNGGVHLNSGIPNRAFYLVADALGGNAWETPGHIWYETLTGGALASTSDFAAFAAATAHTAARLYGNGGAAHDAVMRAWATVGVVAAIPSPLPQQPAPPPPPSRPGVPRPPE
ncbi:peptidase M4 family protein [Cryobacterium sp. TMT1-2-2]|uniref:M4 family metallopeptidase n=1 Tax=Cryobacterium sp. TMT1-2-2 TaxID=1259233 RepID=UPI00106B9B67|nr:M4 family metallopeptidase [Cryobacterium sp. TMT1-2-2]TFD08897.1 peptidase M4 family protein [Cryobacterium sp. TMT1-2-2]